MAIAFDSSSKTTGSSVTSLSVSHTCSGSNRILIVFTGLFVGGAPPPQCTGVTYNSVPMTRFSFVNTQNNNELSGWYLINPATGTNTIQASYNMSANGAFLFGVSYTGAKQSSQPDQSSGANGTGSSWSSSLTTVDNNCWVVGASVCGTGPINTPSGTTSRENDTLVFTSRMVDTNGPITPAGSVSWSWTQGATDSWGSLMFSIAPVGTSAPRLLSLMGVGM